MPCIDFEKELNPDQYAAVCAPADVPALVLAGAGSGKTRTLTYRVARFIAECKIYPQELLLLTFTNKAANQMLERVCALTGVEAWKFWGGTFHSVANRFLRKEGASIGINPDFTIADADDSEKMLKHCVEANFPKFFANKENPRASLLKEIISYSRNTCKTAEQTLRDRFAWLETSPEEIEKIAKVYEDARRGASILDFDDLLELWLKLLQEDECVRERYAARFKNVLVDEYQDTNTLQCRILDLLCASGRISAVGDDAQSIYSWRGANIENILNFKKRYPQGAIYKIGLNYRSTPQILDFANGILEGHEAGEDFKKYLTSSRGGSKKPYIIRPIDALSQAKIAVDLIEELTRGYKPEYKLSDIAVLYRAHFQAMDFQMQLNYRNIPFAITSGAKFFEQAHIKDAVAQIKFAANPRDLMSFIRFMCFLPKVGEKTAQKIYDKAVAVAEKAKINIVEALASKEILAKVPEAARQFFPAVAAGILDVNLSVRKARLKNSPAEDLFEKNTPAMPPKDMVRSVCGSWYADCMKNKYDDWQDRIKDFDALYEYASRFPDIDMFLASASLEMGEGAGAKDAGQYGERVSLMTVHQAKGLEFPVVFVIGASEGLFPLERCIEEGDIEEERRLFYVAATRAKDLLVITSPKIVMARGRAEMREPSRFWAGVDKNLYERNY